MRNRNTTGWSIILIAATVGGLGACSDVVQPRALAAPPIADLARLDLSAMTLVTIDVPGSTDTFAMDVNADDDVVGRFGLGGATHGFLRTVDGQFTTIDFPGASFTAASGINNRGDIVGMYALPTAPTERHGFLLSDGEYTTLDPAGSKFTNLLGVGPSGDIVGRYCTKIPCGRAGSGPYHGLLVHDGEITSFDVPTSVETNAWKITPQGSIVGGFRYADNVNHLFVLRADEFSTIDLPRGLRVAQDDGAMNPRGDIVGTYCVTSPCDLTTAGRRGFVLRDGQLASIELPGAITTSAQGINAHGDVAGAYGDASARTHGYLLKR